MMTFKSTREVARALGIRPGKLSTAVWDGKVAEPQKAPSGAFLWTIEDIRRAGWVLLHREIELPTETIS